MTVDEHLMALHVKLPASLYARLDAYWHDRRLPSRTAAVRQFIERCLDEAAEQRVAKAREKARAR